MRDICLVVLLGKGAILLSKGESLGAILFASLRMNVCTRIVRGKCGRLCLYLSLGFGYLSLSRYVGPLPMVEQREKKRKGMIIRTSMHITITLVLHKPSRAYLYSRTTGHLCLSRHNTPSHVTT